MNVGQLKQKLAQLDDELEIRLVIPTLNPEDEENFWLTELDVSEKGSSGYEEDGEVRLIGEE
jgi:hypothetical protein